MTDPIVTHADLPVLRRLRTDTCDPVDGGDCPCPGSALLDRLIAAAEADAPLPEGWVLYTSPADSEAVVWHQDGSLYRWQDDDKPFWTVADAPGKCTPLRPTVTEAAAERAAIVYYTDNAHATEWPTSGHPDDKREALHTARTILNAAGVDVR